jgi:hypothetical protein
VFTQTQFEQLDADAAKHLRLEFHPSVSLLNFTQNTVGIWSSLMCDELPPRPFRLDAPQHVLVWRQGDRARMRILGDEECHAVETVQAHASFERLCDRLTLWEPRDDPRIRASAYVRGWIDSGVLADANVGVLT